MKEDVKEDISRCDLQVIPGHLPVPINNLEKMLIAFHLLERGKGR